MLLEPHSLGAKWSAINKIVQSTKLVWKANKQVNVDWLIVAVAVAGPGIAFEQQIRNKPFFMFFTTLYRQLACQSSFHLFPLTGNSRL